MLAPVGTFNNRVDDREPQKQMRRRLLRRIKKPKHTETAPDPKNGEHIDLKV